MRFVPAPEYPVFPTRERPLQPYEAVVRTVPVTREAIREAAPDGRRARHPDARAGAGRRARGVAVGDADPPRPPDERARCGPVLDGRAAAADGAGPEALAAMERPVLGGLRRGRDELNETRRLLGLPPLDRLFGGLSERLCMVATFPQLEYPRPWPPAPRWSARCCGSRPTATCPRRPGTEPLVLIAPSTAQDPDHQLLRAALVGLAGEPVRVLAALTNRRGRSAAAASRQRAPGRLDLLLAHDAALRGGDQPRRPRHGRAGARQRGTGARGAALRRHGRERRAGRLGGGRRPAAVAAALAGRRCASSHGGC